MLTVEHVSSRGKHISRSLFFFKGIFGTTLSTAVHTWGLNLKGPVYVTIFQPFSIAIAAAMSVVFLGDALYLGRYIETSLLFYFVLLEWNYELSHAAIVFSFIFVTYMQLIVCFLCLV